MTSGFRTVGAAVAVLIAGGALVALYLRHHEEAGAETTREAPVVAPSRVERTPEAVLVSIDSADADRIGLEIASVSRVTHAPGERLAGEVLAEAERIAVLRAPVAGRLAVAPGARWPRLGERVTAGAPIARVSDALPMAVSLSGVVTRINAQPGAIVEAGQELLEVVDRSHPLVRVVWSERAGNRPRPSILLGPVGEAPTVTGRLIGPAPEADPATRRPAYLYRADRAWLGATAGTPVVAVVPDTAVTRKATVEPVLVPDRAVVQWDGLAWVYVRRAPGRFERVRIPTDRPGAGGWITAGPVAEGDSVVVTGAQELLSEEFRARVTVGDESGE